MARAKRAKVAAPHGAAEKAAATHAFLVKTGTVFTGRIERETKIDIVLGLGRGSITLEKSYIVSKDGAPYPPKRKSRRRRVDVPLVLTHDRDYSTDAT